jgi:CelD/BcsL family acetyltransferase involved in cellulose biosynthesis
MPSSHGRGAGDEKVEPRYRVDQISSEQQLSKLETDWNKLSATAEQPNPFTTYGWFQAWVKWLSQDNCDRLLPNVLVVKADGAVVGIAPLVRRTASRLFRVRKLEFAANHADYNDFVLGGDPRGQIGAVAEFLAQTSGQWDVIDLRDLRDNGDGTAMIESTLTRAGLFYRIFPEKDACPYLAIEGDSACLMERLSGHVRRVLHKRIERAATEGLRMRVVENPQLEPELLEKLIALDHQKTLSGIYPPFISKYADVFRSLIDNLGPGNWLYVALLELGDHPAGYQIGFRCGDKLWDYNKAYDESFSRFAPGTLLLTEMLDYGFQRGYREYDFLRGEEPYKLVWSTASHQRFRLLIWNRRAISRVRKFIYHDVKEAIRSLTSKRTPSNNIVA